MRRMARKFVRSESELCAYSCAIVSIITYAGGAHHRGAVSSAVVMALDVPTGGTAVSVRNKWATRFLAKGADPLDGGLG
jgi:hypothetical protein